MAKSTRTYWNPLLAENAAVGAYLTQLLIAGLRPVTMRVGRQVSFMVLLKQMLNASYWKFPILAKRKVNIYEYLG